MRRQTRWRKVLRPVTVVLVVGLFLWSQPIFAQGPEWTWQNPLPTGNDLYGVWGSSGADSGPPDVYAVGWGGTILHYDGSSWSRMSSGTDRDLRGVWGSSGADSGPPDIYAVGWGGTILHYGPGTRSVLFLPLVMNDGMP
jgi:hypothetical protein